MKDVMRLIKEKRDLHGSHKGVEIKLRSFWGIINIQKFERFTKVVFLESYNFHVQIRVVDGCISVSWIVPDLYKRTDALLNDKSKLHNFMRTLGIISLKIGNSTIYQCLDGGCSVLGSAFLQALELEQWNYFQQWVVIQTYKHTQVLQQ